MGKVYFISGATRGIGLQLATQLAQADPSNTVIATARDPTKAIGLKELASTQKNVHIIKLDISSEESINGIDEQISSLVSESGIDAYISNGAIGDCAPFKNLDRQNYIDHYLINVLGPIQIVNVMYKYIFKTSTRQLFFVSSLAGQLTNFLPVLTGAYGQTKAALNQSVLQLSFQYKQEGFTVVAIHPGVVNTDMTNAAIDAMPKELAELGETFRASAIPPAQSASGIIDNIINKVTIEDDGKFISNEGVFLPY